MLSVSSKPTAMRCLRPAASENVCTCRSGASVSPGRKATTSMQCNATTRSSSGSGASDFYGPNRRLYLPDMEAPEWLDGTMPGDHGCDPFAICSNPSTIDQFRRGEVMNGRFAMLGTVGMLVPEILAESNPDIKGAVWWQTGSEMLHGGTLNYFGTPVPINLQGVIISNALLVFMAEWFRFQEFAPGYEPSTNDSLYPGGAFDPLGLSEDPELFQKLKVNEVRNGRLAMMGFLGFIWQAYITRKGPWENVREHLADPNAHNIFTEWPNEGVAVALS